MNSSIVRVFGLSCRQCGQAGGLWITEQGFDRAWAFTTVGFIGLAVNRHNPPNSVLRCNGCGSSVVRVEATPAE